VQVGRVPVRRGPRGLDLYGEEPQTALSDEGHLGARRRTPIRDVGSRSLGISPGKQVGEHVVRELRSRRLPTPQGQGEARIAPVQFRRLD
jgi:hypothetical protein